MIRVSAAEIARRYVEGNASERKAIDHHLEQRREAERRDQS